MLRRRPLLMPTAQGHPRPPVIAAAAIKAVRLEAAIRVVRLEAVIKAVRLEATEAAELTVEAAREVLAAGEYRGSHKTRLRVCNTLGDTR